MVGQAMQTLLVKQPTKLLGEVTTLGKTNPAPPVVHAWLFQNGTRCSPPVRISLLSHSGSLSLLGNTLQLGCCHSHARKLVTSHLTPSLDW